MTPGAGRISELKATKTSGGGRTPVRHTIPLGIVIFLVLKGVQKMNFSKGCFLMLFS